MLNYEVTMFTGNRFGASTLNKVFMKLVGTDGEQLCETRAIVSCFTISCPVSIGKLLLIELYKEPSLWFWDDPWFVRKVEVKSPEGDIYQFPIYQWIHDKKRQYFREGKALKIFEDNYNFSGFSREQELKEREQDYSWDVYAEGIPHIMKTESIDHLPSEIRFSFSKSVEFGFTTFAALTELRLLGYLDHKENWTDIDSIDYVFCFKQTALSEYVQKHWKEDWFFGYYFLNSVHPTIIQRCSALPENLPVTDKMVFLNGQSSLEDEMKKGNIFLCDYKCLDGVKENTINGKKQYLMAPLVLLHKTPDDKMMPIAIQLKQEPADDNPIFFPTDSEYDWLMAKIFVKSADFSLHQLNAHLLRTHLLAEVFAVSLLRNMPMVHPLYKLLVPHTRYTLHINNLARLRLISENGTFTKCSASGGEAMITILKRSLSSLTYSSLCIPENIAARGLEDVPNFFYRDDALRLWDIIHRFVKGLLSYYYKNDAEVQKDSELQTWISDIFQHGFLSRVSSGIPERFTSVDDLVKFVTMVMFTCSAQHSAVNSGQFDYGGWMPNSPSSLQLPPPTRKGTANEATMLQTLPDVNITVQQMASLWLLSRQSIDFVPLGQYPEEHFSEDTPIKMIRDFQGDLKVLSADIKARNKDLEIPYEYLDPEAVENSVAV